MQSAVNTSAGANPAPVSSNQGSSNNAAAVAGRVFPLRASIVDSRGPIPLAQPPVVNPFQIDPAELARLAAEEELKRRGGGGGGPRFISPSLTVLYSMRLINEALRRAYEAFVQATQQGLPAAAQVVNNVLASIQGAITNALNPVANAINNTFGQTLAQLSNAINSALRNPLATVNKFMNNVTHLGMVIASAIASGLKRLFYGKEEERLDPDNEIYGTEDNLFTRIVDLFTLEDNPDKQSNGKNIRAHINNLANQVTRWVNTFSYPFKEFSKRWFS